MPVRFYFDLENGQDTIRDDEGIEADDLPQAIEQARTGIEDLRAGGELTGASAGWDLVIRDASGTVIDRLPLAAEGQKPSASD